MTELNSFHCFLCFVRKLFIRRDFYFDFVVDSTQRRFPESRCPLAKMARNKIDGEAWEEVARRVDRCEHERGVEERPDDVVDKLSNDWDFSYSSSGRGKEPPDHARQVGQQDPKVAHYQGNDWA